MNEDAIKSISHLYAAGNLLNSTILRTYYFTKCTNSLKQNRLQADKNFTNAYSRCPKCRIARDQTNANYKIKHGVNDKFLSKLKRKHCLTKYQSKYLKQHPTGNHNIMIITCQLCGHVAEKKMDKPEKAVKPEEPETPIKRTKKRKHNAKFSGLNVDAVMSVKNTGIKKIKREDSEEKAFNESKEENTKNVFNNGKNEENNKNKMVNEKNKQNINKKISNGMREKTTKIKNGNVDNQNKDGMKIKKPALNTSLNSARSVKKVTNKNKSKLNNMFSNKTKASKSLTAFLQSI